MASRIFFKRAPCTNRASNMVGYWFLKVLLRGKRREKAREKNGRRVTGQMNEKVGCGGETTQ